ncbi:MAG: NAD(P)-dependent glycerol-3-phosphate dehydrogenase [Gammaproteobacteria bacterium]|nr:MAG: NAD(P)-dependent glycerol-3-phosphate dehydrogenase [Gammaproteobacteria bacterium]
MSGGETIGVIGAGAWGTALAMQLARNGHSVLLWGREREELEAMRQQRENPRYLPGIPFPEGLEAEPELERLLARTRQLLVAVPSEGFRDTLTRLAPAMNTDAARLLWATKGLETGSGRLLHEVAEEILPGGVPTAVVSGPSFAAEVARGLPTAVTVASRDADFRRQAAGWLHGDTFRCYLSDDVIGVEVGGALKNVLAIATGISDGLGFGANARAALITRGLAEIMRLGIRLGARSETLMGLSGMGDLVLTCTDDQSRNRRLGMALGRGATLEEALREVNATVEGMVTARVVSQVARQQGVEMPICQQVDAILHHGKVPSIAVSELLGRDLREEGVGA